MSKNNYSCLPLIIGLIGILSSVLLVEAYKAAVVSYKPLQAIFWRPDQTVAENAQNFVKKIQEAKGKADIIVFPEYGLTTLDVNNSSAEHLSAYSIDFDEKITNPCNKENADPHLNKLSCAAKSSNMYIVFNVIENDKKKFYLTTVVMDAGGNITVKCRRSDVPPISSFAKGDKLPCLFKANFSNAETNFSVIQDPELLHSVPSDIDNVILTSAVNNSIPFNYVPSILTGFAVRNRINLLVAGYYDNLYGGSGIFNIKNEQLIGNATLGALAPNKTEVVIYQEVIGNMQPKKDSSVQAHVILDVKKPMSFPFTNVTTSTATTNDTDYKICTDGEFCCNFKAITDRKTIYPYKWVIFVKNTTVFGKPVDTFYCGLMKPEKEPAMAFKIEISSTYSKTAVHQVLPVAIKNNFEIPEYVYKETDAGSHLSLTENQDVISFGIIHVLRSSATRLGCLASSFMFVFVLIWMGN